MDDHPIVYAEAGSEIREIEGCFVATPAIKDGLPEDNEYPIADLRWGKTKEGIPFVLATQNYDQWIRAYKFLKHPDARDTMEACVREIDLGGVTLSPFRPLLKFLLGRGRPRPYRQLLGIYVAMTATFDIPPRAARFALGTIEGFNDAWRDVTYRQY